MALQVSEILERVVVNLCGVADPGGGGGGGEYVGGTGGKSG